MKPLHGQWPSAPPISLKINQSYVELVVSGQWTHRGRESLKRGPLCCLRGEARASEDATRALERAVRASEKAGKTSDRVGRASEEAERTSDRVGRASEEARRTPKAAASLSGIRERLGGRDFGEGVGGNEKRMP